MTPATLFILLYLGGLFLMGSLALFFNLDKRPGFEAFMYGFMVPSIIVVIGVALMA